MNGDCGVNMIDFAVFAKHWRREICNAANNWCRGTDFDRSGRVTTADLAIFVEDWLYGI